MPQHSTSIKQAAPISRSLLVPDRVALARKLQAPNGVLGELWGRFTRQLETDADFRQENLFLMALLPKTSNAVLDEIGHIVAEEANRLDQLDSRHDGVEHHTWCVAPSALRMATYATWLAKASAWGDDEFERIGALLLNFCEAHCINVLRSRVPASDNQSMSLALTCAVVGQAFVDCEVLSLRARRLHEAGVQRLEWVLGLADEEGYLGEGSTYTSHVVTPLTMWTAALFEQLYGREVLAKTWLPGKSSLLNILRIETLLPSPGAELPGWDHHGWQQQVNLAALALWARLTGEMDALSCAREVWERRSMVAWGQDDRMWALLYWPDEPVPMERRCGLSGWSLPHTAAALDDYGRRVRLMLCFDRCTDSLQSVGRGQTNPNHLLYEIEGSPIFGDGKVCTEGSIGLEPREGGDWLTPDQRLMIERQFGSVAAWCAKAEEGFIGAANSIVIDHEETWFHAEAARGRLVFESREAARHIVAADARLFYQPRYNLTRATRSIAMTSDGPCWIVDDYRANHSHTFAWQLYLRRGCQRYDRGLTLRTSDGKLLSIAWLPVVREQLDEVPDFPVQGGKGSLNWPETGSQRLQLYQTGEAVRFVVCLIPHVATAVHIEQAGDLTWRASWPKGEQVFSLPAEALEVRDPDPLPPMTFCDLDQTPYPSPSEVEIAVKERLRSPSPENWRRTIETIQGLSAEGESAALPLIHRLMMDPAQRYQVHAVAAWRLGRAAYAPAREDLQRCAHAAEPNLARRARWAVERIDSR